MTILEKILAQKRIEVDFAKTKLSLNDLRQQPPYIRHCFSLAEALRRKKIGIIAEIKRASPSRGVIRENFLPAVFARAYAENGAAAISVLTDVQFFQGNLGNMRDIRNCVSLPLLRKDFIIEEYQIHEAKANGADAVLLIAAALEKNLLFDLHQAATGIGLEVLVEVHTQQELEKFDFGIVKLVGINNRNLSTFDVDVSTSLRLKEYVPDGTLVISESGIESADQLLRLASGGIHSFLIGESFMRAEDPGAALRALLEEVRS
jgi:indole-3-glycerol phosphate synthase